MQEYNDKRLVTSGHRTMLVMNKAVAWLTNLGISLMGSRVLSVRGRKSGEWHSTPVNLLTVDGQRYLVAPRGHIRPRGPAAFTRIRTTGSVRYAIGTSSTSTISTAAGSAPALIASSFAAAQARSRTS